MHYFIILLQREQNDLKKLREFVDPNELALAQAQVSRDDHMTKLHEDYKALEGEYLNIIEKIASHNSH